MFPDQGRAGRVARAGGNIFLGGAIILIATL